MAVVIAPIEDVQETLRGLLAACPLAHPIAPKDGDSSCDFAAADRLSYKSWAQSSSGCSKLGVPPGFTADFAASSTLDVSLFFDDLGRARVLPLPPPVMDKLERADVGGHTQDGARAAGAFETLRWNADVELMAAAFAAEIIRRDGSGTVAAARTTTPAGSGGEVLAGASAEGHGAGSAAVPDFASMPKALQKKARKAAALAGALPAPQPHQSLPAVGSSACENVGISAVPLPTLLSARPPHRIRLSAGSAGHGSSWPAGPFVTSSAVVVECPMVTTSASAGQLIRSSLVAMATNAEYSPDCADVVVLSFPIIAPSPLAASRGLAATLTELGVVTAALNSTQTSATQAHRQPRVLLCLTGVVEALQCNTPAVQLMAQLSLYLVLSALRAHGGGGSGAGSALASEVGHSKRCFDWRLAVAVPSSPTHTYRDQLAMYISTTFNVPCGVAALALRADDDSTALASFSRSFAEQLVADETLAALNDRVIPDIIAARGIVAADDADVDEADNSHDKPADDCGALFGVARHQWNFCRADVAEGARSDLVAASQRILALHNAITTADDDRVGTCFQDGLPRRQVVLVLVSSVGEAMKIASLVGETYTVVPVEMALLANTGLGGIATPTSASVGGAKVPGGESDQDGEDESPLPPLVVMTTVGQLAATADLSLVRREKRGFELRHVIAVSGSTCDAHSLVAVAAHFQCMMVAANLGVAEPGARANEGSLSWALAHVAVHYALAAEDESPSVAGFSLVGAGSATPLGCFINTHPSIGGSSAFAVTASELILALLSVTSVNCSHLIRERSASSDAEMIGSVPTYCINPSMLIGANDVACDGRGAAAGGRGAAQALRSDFRGVLDEAQLSTLVAALGIECGRGALRPAPPQLRTLPAVNLLLDFLRASECILPPQGPDDGSPRLVTDSMKDAGMVLLSLTPQGRICASSASAVPRSWTALELLDRLCFARGAAAAAAAVAPLHDCVHGGIAHTSILATRLLVAALVCCGAASTGIVALAQQLSWLGELAAVLPADTVAYFAGSSAEGVAGLPHAAISHTADGDDDGSFSAQCGSSTFAATLAGALHRATKLGVHRAPTRGGEGGTQAGRQTLLGRTGVYELLRERVGGGGGGGRVGAGASAGGVLLGLPNGGDTLSELVNAGDSLVERALAARDSDIAKSLKLLRLTCLIAASPFLHIHSGSNAFGAPASQVFPHLLSCVISTLAPRLVSAVAASQAALTHAVARPELVLACADGIRHHVSLSDVGASARGDAPSSTRCRGYFEPAPLTVGLAQMSDEARRVVFDAFHAEELADEEERARQAAEAAARLQPSTASAADEEALQSHQRRLQEVAREMAEASAAHAAAARNRGGAAAGAWRGTANGAATFPVGSRFIPVRRYPGRAAHCTLELHPPSLALIATHDLSVAPSAAALAGARDPLAAVASPLSIHATAVVPSATSDALLAAALALRVSLRNTAIAFEAQRQRAVAAAATTTSTRTDGAQSAMLLDIARLPHDVAHSDVLAALVSPCLVSPAARGGGHGAAAPVTGAVSLLWCRRDAAGGTCNSWIDAAWPTLSPSDESQFDRLSLELRGSAVVRLCRDAVRQGIAAAELAAKRARGEPGAAGANGAAAVSAAAVFLGDAPAEGDKLREVIESYAEKIARKATEAEREAEIAKMRTKAASTKNPLLGFLQPAHRFHAYFRHLVRQRGV